MANTGTAQQGEGIQALVAQGTKTEVSRCMWASSKT